MDIASILNHQYFKLKLHSKAAILGVAAFSARKQTGDYVLAQISQKIINCEINQFCHKTFFSNFQKCQKVLQTFDFDFNY